MAIPKRTISGTIYRPDGTGIAGGSISIQLSHPGSVMDEATLKDERVAGVAKVAIGADGAVEFDLVPNDEISPTGTFYRVTFRDGDGAEWSDAWEVPSGGAPLAIGAVPTKQGVALSPSFVRLSAVSSLPTAGPEWHRVMVTIQQAGGPEQGFVCVKNADGSFGWAQAFMGAI